MESKDKKLQQTSPLILRGAFIFYTEAVKHGNKDLGKDHNHSSLSLQILMNSGSLAITSTCNTCVYESSQDHSFLNQLFFFPLIRQNEHFTVFHCYINKTSSDFPRSLQTLFSITPAC